VRTRAARLALRIHEAAPVRECEQQRQQHLHLRSSSLGQPWCGVEVSCRNLACMTAALKLKTRSTTNSQIMQACNMALIHAHTKMDFCVDELVLHLFWISQLSCGPRDTARRPGNAGKQECMLQQKVRCGSKKRLFDSLQFNNCTPLSDAITLCWMMCCSQVQLRVHADRITASGNFLVNGSAIFVKSTWPCPSHLVFVL
jgi:hypothetical protein